MSSDPPRLNSAKQSPPIPVDPNSTTLWTAHAATAASTAFPPLFRISTAVRVAVLWDVAAIPFLPAAIDRPGSSKLRMAFISLCRTSLEARRFLSCATQTVNERPFPPNTRSATARIPSNLPAAPPAIHGPVDNRNAARPPGRSVSGAGEGTTRSVVEGACRETDRGLGVTCSRTRTKHRSRRRSRAAPPGKPI